MNARSGNLHPAGRVSGTNRKWMFRLSAISIIIAFSGWLFFRLTALPERDLMEIRQSGRIRILISYDPINYFIYRGTPMGFSYELAQNFSRYLGIPIEVVVVSDMNRQLSMLGAHNGDIVAHLVTITPERVKAVNFSTPLDSARQVLVQRFPESGNPASPVRHMAQLEGKRIHVRQNSAYYPELKRIEKEKRVNIEIVEAEGELSTSRLIEKVHDGTFDYTVADENIALTHKAIFPSLDITTRISEKMPLAWAVRKSSPELLAVLNQWILQSTRSGELAVIRNKYYSNQYHVRNYALQALFSEQDGTISRYDDLVKKQADTIGWDWRLLSSLIYEESRFDPGAISWAGAVGLMQLMPATAAHFRARNLFDPAENLKAGILYIRFLEKEWQDIRDPSTRMKFVLASYNIGSGHVRDARRLAGKYGANVDHWENHVEKYLILKSDPLYFNDPVSRFGYCNGKNAAMYTRNILDRYRLYSQVIPRQ